MLTDWIHWLSSKNPEQLVWLLAPVLLFDVTRYSIGFVGMFLWDFVALLLGFRTPQNTESPYAYCPSVCVVIAGLNEADSVARTLDSVWGSYPRLEIIVVDDGSSDGMANVATTFATMHDNVLVLRNPRRGGKSAALNFALPFTRASIIVCVDADSQLCANAIWEIVQPFVDSQVGAVSGTVLARNPFAKLVTWLQSFEYLRCIFIGRQLAARLDMLGIISGAFGAYRRTAIQQQMGWDVGPGEDGDLTLRLRKSGFRIGFAPYAQCLTNLPTTWGRLFRQRRRWEWAVITFECRKHVDLGNPLSPNFRMGNLLVLLERWTYNVLFTYLLWAYAVCSLFYIHQDTWKLYLLFYFMYVAMELANWLVILYYSINRGRDFLIGFGVPLMPFYHLLLRAVMLYSVTEELLSRRSFRDNFVPQHVREATWHW